MIGRTWAFEHIGTKVIVYTLGSYYQGGRAGGGGRLNLERVSSWSDEASADVREP